VRVYDFGRAGDSFFLVMEYLHGDTLLALLPRAVATPEGLPLEITLTVMLGVCAGLHFAHEATGPDGSSLGLVHRDITPANVFATQSGEVKVLDFGIAKAISAGTITRVGGRKGKVAYMSPEQCLGAPIDRRSDIFALGILLYEMTTAKRLFRGNTEFEVMDMITAGQVPPPSTRALDYPPALEAVVLKALARDPAERYATAQELHDALEQVALELGLRPSAAALGRFVRKLTNDKRYPSLEPETDDDAPTLNFFASLNEAITSGDLPMGPDAPFAPIAPIAHAPDAEPHGLSPGPTPMQRSRAVLALVGAGALILLIGTSLLTGASLRSRCGPSRGRDPERGDPDGAADWDARSDAHGDARGDACGGSGGARGEQAEGLAPQEDRQKAHPLSGVLLGPSIWGSTAPIGTGLARAQRLLRRQQVHADRAGARPWNGIPCSINACMMPGQPCDTSTAIPAMYRAAADG
jgi:hypothetical protein